MVPTDCVEGQLIIGAHVYAPGSFTSQGDDAEAPVWTDAMAQELTSVLQTLRNTFPTLPVIIGEFGANSKASDSECAKYAKVFIDKADELELGRFYWFDIINRNTYTWIMPLLMAVLLGEDSTTAIGDAIRLDYGEKIADNNIYDLQGRCVGSAKTDLSPLTSHLSPLKKGLYIVNGRKIIQK